VRHREALEDLAERASLEPGRPECSDEIADLAQGTLEQAHRLPRPLLGRRVGGERALEHLQLGQRGENVLHRAVVHIEHDALQLPLAGGGQAPRGGPGLGVAILGHGRRDATSCGSRSAANPSAAPIASAIATRTPPSTLAARSPIATPAPANAPAVQDRRGTRACSTIPTAAAPNTSARTRSRPPRARKTACAASAQTTPDAVAARVRCQPRLPP